MTKVSIFGHLSNIQMLLHTALKGVSVGKDGEGNKYYKGKPGKDRQQERRWVMYAADPEASTVPPEWHGWLHHQTNVIPSEQGKYRKPWQLPHKPNMTGSDQAYFPPGVLKKDDRPATASDYTPWQPPQQ